MPNPDPSPETRFHKGRAKTGGRQRGTPNKPKTVKVAWREFTDGFGDEMVAFAKHVLFELPDVMPAGEKGYVNFIPAKLDVWRESMRYGIGKHANQAQDTGRGDLIVQPKSPIGTDPDAMERYVEEEIERRGLVPGRRPGQAPVRDRGAIFNRALLKAVAHPEATEEVKAALRTDDGDQLEVVEEQLPEIFNRGPAADRSAPPPTPGPTW